MRRPLRRRGRKVKEGKNFFLEKKQQKTFICFALCRTTRRGSGAMSKIFLLLFFKKEVLILPSNQ
jgi:Gpi18-like mannosyltransferase